MREDSHPDPGHCSSAICHPSVQLDTDSNTGSIRFFVFIFHERCVLSALWWKRHFICALEWHELLDNLSYCLLMTPVCYLQLFLLTSCLLKNYIKLWKESKEATDFIFNASLYCVKGILSQVRCRLYFSVELNQESYKNLFALIILVKGRASWTDIKTYPKIKCCPRWWKSHDALQNACLGFVLVSKQTNWFMQMQKLHNELFWQLLFHWSSHDTK